MKRFIILAVMIMSCALAPVVIAKSHSSSVVVSKPISAINGWSLGALSASQLNAQLTTISAEGVTAVRNDATWNTIEPQSGVWSWTYYDSIVKAYAQHHLTWMPILDYSASWAASAPGDLFSPPASDAAFATYAAAVATRYGPGGAFWKANPSVPAEPVTRFEVWNEENGGYFWDAGPQPLQYGELYEATRAAIHQVDPSAIVVVGGLVYYSYGQGEDGAAFAVDMINDLPGLVVDEWGLHPYDSTGVNDTNDVAGFRYYLGLYGNASVPIDVNEFGWEYSKSNESWRASQMSTIASNLGDSNCGISVLAPYDWANTSGQDDYGLASLTALRPAGTSWFSGLKTAKSSSLCS